MVMLLRLIFVPNVPHHPPRLASGVPCASADGMTEVRSGPRPRRIGVGWMRSLAFLVIPGKDGRVKGLSGIVAVGWPLVLDRSVAVFGPYSDSVEKPSGPRVASALWSKNASRVSWMTGGDVLPGFLSVELVAASFLFRARSSSCRVAFHHLIGRV